MGMYRPSMEASVKLIYCPKCQDVVRLVQYQRSCDCGASNGRYTDDLHAEIAGSAIPLGFANDSLVDALRGRTERGMGRRFEAFVIPSVCETVNKGEKT